MGKPFNLYWADATSIQERDAQAQQEGKDTWIATHIGCALWVRTGTLQTREGKGYYPGTTLAGGPAKGSCVVLYDDNFSCTTAVIEDRIAIESV